MARSRATWGQPKVYLFTCVLFVTGVIFGALMVNALSPLQHQELLNTLNRFFLGIKQEGILQSSFPAALGYPLRTLGMIWILGLSVIGFPLILFILFAKGVTLGFSVGFLVNQLSWKGLLFAAGSVVPHNLLLVPALVIASTAGITFSLALLRNQFWQQQTPLQHHIAGYTGLFLLMGGVMVTAALVEVYISPYLLRWLTPMII